MTGLVGRIMFGIVTVLLSYLDRLGDAILFISATITVTHAVDGWALFVENQGGCQWRVV